MPRLDIPTLPTLFAKEFFDLQFRFAERVRALTGMSLERALLEYTNLYVRFGFGRDFDADRAEVS